MSEFLIPDINPAVEKDLGKGTYILIMYASRIPPHLSLVIDSQVYTLSVKGPKLAMPLEVQLKLIRARKIESVFVKLRYEMLVQDEYLYRQAEKHTLAFTRVEPGIATCLSPIKNFCGQVFGFDVEGIHFIYDLLATLYSRQVIDHCSHLNMEPFMIGSTFHLTRYSMQDIYESIYRSDTLIQAL